MISFFKQKYDELILDTRFSPILTGSAWALGARVVATGFGLAFNVLVARLYGAEMLGIVAVINSFLLVVTIFTLFGTQTSILRLIPEHTVKFSVYSAYKIYSKAQYMVILVSIFTTAICISGSNFIANNLFSKPNLSYYFFLASLFIIVQSILKLNTHAVRGLGLIKAFGLVLLLPQLCSVFGLLFIGSFLKLNQTPVYAVFFGMVITSFVAWFIVNKNFRKKIRPNDRIEQVPCRTIIAISLPMLVTSTMAIIVSETSIFMLGIFRSEAEVGYFAVAVRLSILTSFILDAVNSITGPKFSEFFHANKLDDLFYVAKKSAKMIFMISTPILFFLLFFGKQILLFVFGSEFVGAYIPLVILVFGQFINAVSGSSGLFMNMTGNQNIFKNIMILSMLINVGLNYLLVPSFGINGAAVASMVTICFWNLSTLAYMKIKYGSTTGYFPWITSKKEKVV